MPAMDLRVCVCFFVCLTTIAAHLADPCTFNNQCKHGSCVVYQGKPQCECEAGFYGKFCNVHCEHLCHEQPNTECSPANAEFPENKGKCVCKSGFVPVNNPSAIYLTGCVTPDHPCVANNPCVHGLCEDGGEGNAVCNCPYGYYGSRCELQTK